MLELTRVFISENIIALFQKTLIAWKLLICELFLRYEFNKITHRIGKKLFQSSLYSEMAVFEQNSLRSIPSGSINRTDTEY
jgi:hypothetical protein